MSTFQIHVVKEKRDDKKELEERLVNEARQIFREQAETIAALAGRIGVEYSEAIELLIRTRGHVVVTGIGKSGLIGQKMAATFASTGTPSFFVHAAEAFHGDLGMITDRDAVILISYSGETEEVIRLIPHLRDRGIPTVALLGGRDSTLARGVNVSLDVSVNREACPNNLAPTNSTLATLAVGDALAVSLMNMRNFGADDFARFHPGGRLGRRLHTRVRDVMRDSELPVVAPSDGLQECLLKVASGRLGLSLVVEGDSLRGTVTAKQLEEALRSTDSPRPLRVGDLMNSRPAIIDKDAWMAEAETRAKVEGTNIFVVVDCQDNVTGVLELTEG